MVPFHGPVGFESGTVRVWRVPSWELALEFAGPTKRVPDVEFRPDGSEFVASYWAFGAEPKSDNMLIFFDTETFKVSRRIPTRAPTHRIGFSPGGAVLATYDHLGTQFLDPSSGDRIRELPPASFLAFTSDGKRFAAGIGPRVAAIYQVGADEPLVQLHGHVSRVLAGRFNRDGTRLVTGSRDKTVRLWDTKTGEQLAVYLGHEWTVTGVTFDVSGQRILSSCWDKTVKIWDASSDNAVPTIHAHGETFLDEAGKPLQRQAITDIVFNRNGTLMATSSRDSTFKLWDSETRQLVREFRGHDQPVESLDFSPDGTRIASTSWDKTVTIWDIDDNSQPRLTLAGHTDRVQGVAFHPDGKWLVSGSRDGTLRVWDAASGEESAVLTSAGVTPAGQKDHIHSVVFSPDGRHFACCGHAFATVCDSATRKKIGAINRGGVVLEDYSLEFDPAGKLLATSSRTGELLLWDVDRRELVTRVPGHTDEIFLVRFSPDGSRMVTASNDRTVKIWDVEHRLPLATLHGYTGLVKRVVFSPNGRFVIGGLDNGQLVFWDGGEGARSGSTNPR